MSTATQTRTTLEAQPIPVVEQHELRQIRRLATGSNAAVQAAPGSAPTPQDEPTPAPWTKLFGAGFSFFCAGVNDGTLGPLIPYILVSFSISTGEIAILYATTFTGWLLAAVTSPILAARLTLGQLLFLGAVLQLMAQCLRPWSPLPVFCVTFFIQALGMAYQDAHSNTFVSSVQLAHRWLGFIHAMYALGCLVGPLVSTAIANSSSSDDRREQWKKTYFVLIGIGVVNLAGVMVGFRDSLWTWQRQTGDEEDVSTAAEGGDRARKSARVAMQELAELMRVKDVWLISAFYFFALGAWTTCAGWVVEYLVRVRDGDLSKVGYVPTGWAGGVLLGRLLLAEPTFRFGEQRMILLYGVLSIGLQLVFWLAPNIIAGATALSIMGFFQGPFFATGVSVASKLFPRKIQAAALSFVFVLAQAGGNVFPAVTGLIATSSTGVQVLQPVVLALLTAAIICWWLVPKVPDRGVENTQ